MKRVSTFPGLAVLAIAAALTACGKDSNSGTGPDGNGGTYFYRFDANGTRVTFNQQVSLTAAFSQSGNQRVAIITGFDATRNSAVQIYSGSTIGTATYTGYTLDVNAAAVVGMIFHYQDATGTVYQSDNTNSNTTTITQLTSTTVRGTFAGRLKATGKADIVVTNGEFFVQRTN
jgi:hypothetical protein